MTTRCLKRASASGALMLAATVAGYLAHQAAASLCLRGSAVPDPLDPGCLKQLTSLPCVVPELPDPLGFRADPEERCGFKRFLIIFVTPCGRPSAVEACAGGSDPDVIDPADPFVIGEESGTETE